VKEYSARLAKSQARAIQEFYVAPRLQADRRALPLHLQLHRAHVLMLGEQDIVPRPAAAAILGELDRVGREGGDALELRGDLNDMYLNLQARLMERLGEGVGGWIHVAMSRNDYGLALARMQIREQLNAAAEGVLTFMDAMLRVAEGHVETVMPGYTHHSQQAQPITFGYFLLACWDAAARDLRRLSQAFATTNASPMGGGAIGATGFPIDRQRVAELLGFDGLVENALDATGGRDFALEAGAAYAIALSGMNRLGESLLLWNTAEFGMIELADQYCHISSIMPQKKNPVTLEIIRAEAVKAQNALNTAFGILKGVPPGNGREPGYAEEMVVEAGERLVVLAPVLADVIATLTVHPDRMLQRAREGFSTMTELADELVRQSDLSFHQAYVLVSELVVRVHGRGRTADTIRAADVDEAAERTLGRRLGVDDDAVRRALDPVQAVARRVVTGGPAPAESRRMLEGRRKLQARLQCGLESRRERVAGGVDRLEAGVRDFTSWEEGR